MAGDKLPTDDNTAVKPDDLLFEPRVIANKGIGLVAIHPIPRGTRILCEKPLCFVSGSAKESDIAAALEKLTSAQHTEFAELSYTESRLSNDARLNILRLLKARNFSGRNLDLAFADSIKLHSIFTSNAVHMGFEGEQGVGVFRNYSRINHSCRPNVNNAWNSTLGRETVHALRDIAAGEELVTSYVPVEQSIKARQQELSEKWDFKCKCEACDGPGADLSEHRRAKMERIEGALRVFEQNEPEMCGIYTQCRGPLPRNEEEALRWAQDLVGLAEKEGMVRELPFAYRECSKLSLKLGHAENALAYAKKELEMERICLGEEDEHREQDLQGARFWLKHLEVLIVTPQYEMKRRMNEKREAKEQKRIEKKAAKKAAKK